MTSNSKNKKPATHTADTAHRLKPAIELFQLLSEWNAQDVQEKREKSNEVSQAVQSPPHKG